MWRSKNRPIVKTDADILSMPADHILRAAQRMGARLDQEALDLQRDRLLASIKADMDKILIATKTLKDRGLPANRVDEATYQALLVALQDLKDAEAALLRANEGLYQPHR